MGRVSRQTEQKKVILEELKNLSTFFTAEDLYEKVKKKKGNIGLATVYRFLKDMRKTHRIYSYSCKGKVVYSSNSRNHSHFTCEKCLKSTHIDIESIDFLKNIEAKVCHFQINVDGICKKCQEKNIAI